MMPPAIATTYLGNLRQDAPLHQRVDASRAAGQCLEVELAPDDQKKARIHVTARCGTAVGIVKPRGTSLAPGDVLVTEQQQLVVIQFAAQELMVLTVSDQEPGQGLALLQLGHTLGNLHYPIQVMGDRVYIPVTGRPVQLEAAIDAVGIPGLTVTYETRSASHPLDNPPASSGPWVSFTAPHTHG